MLNSRSVCTRVDDRCAPTGVYLVYGYTKGIASLSLAMTDKPN